MLFFLFAACGAAFAQEAAGQADSLNRDITVIGRDDTALPVPGPWTHQDIEVPDLDPAQPAAPTLPAIPPPVGDWSTPWLDARTLNPLVELVF